MENMEQFETTKQRDAAYNQYIKTITPKNSLIKDMGAAFLVGGLICLLGQFLQNMFLKTGMPQEDAATCTSICLIALSVILTCLHLFGKIAKFGGAGALVPITGFANSVAACAQEFKAEGQVFGIGCKIFTIAGPVILYGVFTSWVLGLIYWLS